MNELAIFNPTSDVTAMVGKEPQTDEERKGLVNAMMSPTYRLAEMRGQVLELTNFYIEKVQFADKETGEVSDGYRTVLMCADGSSYQCASIGVVNCLKTICGVYGAPDHWSSPLMVRVDEVQSGKNRVYLLNLV